LCWQVQGVQRLGLQPLQSVAASIGIFALSYQQNAVGPCGSASSRGHELNGHNSGRIPQFQFAAISNVSHTCLQPCVSHACSGCQSNANRWHDADDSVMIAITNLVTETSVDDDDDDDENNKNNNKTL
jgi:hypothetical protein